MESPLLRPIGGLSKPSRCRSPIDADTRQPKRRCQPGGTPDDNTPNLPVSQFSLIPSQESGFFGGPLYHHPTFAPGSHGYGNRLDGAAIPAWYSYDYKQDQQEALFSLIVDNSTLGGEDVSPVLDEFPLEQPAGFATRQPFSFTQYVDPTGRWQAQADHGALHTLQHSPIENDNGGPVQPQCSWESATLPLPHNEEAFQAAFSYAFQSCSTPTHSLPPSLPEVSHSISRDSTEVQGRNAYISQVEAQVAYPSGALNNTVDRTHRPCFGAYTLSHVVDDGTLRDSPVALPETQTPRVCSPYVHATKQGGGHLFQASEAHDIDEHVVIPMETPLGGHWVDVQKALVVDVKQEVVLADVIQEVGVKEEPEGQADGKTWKREMLRKQTFETRSMRACIRCHNQRVRCRPNQDNPNDPLAPCVTCLNVRRESKKTIHNLPCLRYKLASVVLHRDGGLGYTKRFDHTQMINIRVDDWTEKGTKVIEMAQGLCEMPMRLKVRAFRAREGDQLIRHFVGRDGIRIPAYGLVDIKSHGKAFQQYLAANAGKGLEESAKNSDDLIREMYAMIARHLQLSSKSRLLTPSSALALQDTQHLEAKRDKKSVDQGEFLQKAIRLWFAIRHQTGSAWICGQETLGMESTDPKARYIPRMIVAQFDSIRYHTVFKSQVPQFLSMFEKVLSSWEKVKGAWFTAFMVMFLFLHNVACICKDRYRYAKENSNGKPLDTRYGAINHPLTKFVEDVQHGAGVMLAYWTYFKRCDLMNLQWDAESVSKSALQELEPHQLAFLKRTVDCLKVKMNSIPATPQEGCWEHELYWISLMFVSEPSMTSSWKPPVIFSVVNPRVGNEK
ncbi:hypothetical protein QBC36DRAFT_306309 [Triangularia setosa]|uniref:Zn(2)-C6 fungal-type domain-containing protein n=1 Tax=Triangularia setosa TaxID=2587417 RepID=A0AAN6WHG0_9PEZI|nr:hypothetical protein QBC36DRAFT_306309 [Podospora setosa]